MNELVLSLTFLAIGLYLLYNVIRLAVRHAIEDADLRRASQQAWE